MIITMPTGARLQNIEAFARSVQDPADPNLELRFPYSYFSVHPMVLAAIAAAGLRARAKGGEVIVDEVPNTPSVRYLERMGLFSILGVESGVDVHAREDAGRFIPLRVIRNGQQLTDFIVQLPPLFHADDHRQAEPIQYVLSELVRNTLEHAGHSQPAVVAAQVYPKSGVIAMGVADYGTGVHRSLSVAHKVTDELHALQLAMRPGITGKTTRVGGTADNAGAGLFFCKAMALTSRNYMVIQSGPALFKLLKTRAGERVRLIHSDPTMDRATRYCDMPAWPGTLVGMDINVGTYREFQGFMEFVRGAYNVDVQAAQRDVKKKKARFT